MEKLVLGVDIGGSHITAELVDLQLKASIPQSWARDKLHPNASAAETIETWATTINRSISSLAVMPERIGIAMPGPMDYKNGICMIQGQGKFESLYNLNVKESLSNRLDFDPQKIFFMNDAACFLKGELYAGSINEFGEAIGLTLGTGLGTSHTVKGNVRDSNLWKMPFIGGIAEDYISTRWFVKRFFELSGFHVKDVREIVDNHVDSSSFNVLFSEFSYNLALFLHQFIRKKMPYAAVIGGNIANAEQYFLPDARRHLNEMMGYSFPLRKSLLGERAAIMGAGVGI